MEIVTLKQAINHFVDRKLIPIEQGFTLEVDKTTESTTYCFSLEEVTAMIQYCNDNSELQWLGDVIVALAHTGMRIGELAQLRWSTVDLERGNIVIVDESRRSAENRSDLRTTKNGRSRQIPILPVVRGALERLYQARNTGHVFTAQKGG